MQRAHELESDEGMVISLRTNGENSVLQVIKPHPMTLEQLKSVNAMIGRTIQEIENSTRRV